jgi:hypothetical protein
MAPMKELPCPQGFTAQTDSGPHLQTEGKSHHHNDSSQDGAQAPEMKKPVARRCVPDKPKKAATASRKKAA